MLLTRKLKGEPKSISFALQLKAVDPVGGAHNLDMNSFFVVYLDAVIELILRAYDVVFETCLVASLSFVFQILNILIVVSKHLVPLLFYMNLLWKEASTEGIIIYIFLPIIYFFVNPIKLNISELQLFTMP